ncbi:hypothetical protein Trydic_g12071 [Trypoxylus dichotomus]
MRDTDSFHTSTNETPVSRALKENRRKKDKGEKYASTCPSWRDEPIMVQDKWVLDNTNVPTQNVTAGFKSQYGSHHIPLVTFQKIGAQGKV